MSPAEKGDNKKTGIWAQYQTLLVRYPFAMNITQSGTIGAAGALTSQLMTKGTVTDLNAIAQQVVLNCAFIAPVVSLWFPLLGSMKLHWILAASVDQFIFSPLFNIAIFWFMTIAFGGGLALSHAHSNESMDLTLSLRYSAFPSLWTYQPVWSTQATAYYLWLPACLLREKAVPEHLKAIFGNVCGFVWAIIFASILAG